MPIAYAWICTGGKNSRGEVFSTSIVCETRAIHKSVSRAREPKKTKAVAISQRSLKKKNWGRVKE